MTECKHWRRLSRVDFEKDEREVVCEGCGEVLARWSEADRVLRRDRPSET